MSERDEMVEVPAGFRGELRPGLFVNNPASGSRWISVPEALAIGPLATAFAASPFPVSSASMASAKVRRRVKRRETHSRRLGGGPLCCPCHGCTWYGEGDGVEDGA